MKKALFFILSLIIFQSCTSQNYLDRDTLTNIVSQENFTFMAEKASPSNYDVVNVMNSLPNSSGARILDLSYGYTIVFRNGEMQVTLPYFGRNFTGGNTFNDNSFRFTSKNYTVTKTEGKKNSIQLKVKPNDIRYINMFYIDISANGKAYVSVNANDRTPISYDGYIMKNEAVK